MHIPLAVVYGVSGILIGIAIVLISLWLVERSGQWGPRF